MSHSFNIKNSLERKRFSKVLSSPHAHFRQNVSVSKSRSVFEISQFFRYFKALALIYSYC